MLITAASAGGELGVFDDGETGDLHQEDNKSKQTCTLHISKRKDDHISISSEECYTATVASKK
jgi:hypothetical protein